MQNLPVYLPNPGCWAGTLRSRWTPSAPGLPEVSGTFAGLKPLRTEGAGHQAFPLH